MLGSALNKAVISITLLCFTIEQVFVHNNVFVYHDH